MEEQKKNECFRCGNFTAYYTKAYCCYLREKYGFCGKHNKLVDKHSSCENWRAKYYDRRKKKSAIMDSLKNVLTDISVIRQFIEEE